MQGSILLPKVFSFLFDLDWALVFLFAVEWAFKGCYQVEFPGRSPEPVSSLCRSRLRAEERDRDCRPSEQEKAQTQKMNNRHLKQKPI